MTSRRIAIAHALETLNVARAAHAAACAARGAGYRHSQDWRFVEVPCVCGCERIDLDVRRSSLPASRKSPEAQAARRAWLAVVAAKAAYRAAISA